MVFTRLVLFRFGFSGKYLLRGFDENLEFSPRIFVFEVDSSKFCVTLVSRRLSSTMNLGGFSRIVHDSVISGNIHSVVSFIVSTNISLNAGQVLRK